MEKWRSIKEYNGTYEVSSLGRVRRVHKDPRVEKYKYLSPDYVKGYARVVLFNKGIGKRFLVHRLVANAFIPNPYKLPQVNHKDENHCNNVVDNLEWCTAVYNVNYGTGTKRQVAKRSKTVLQFDLNDNFITEFPSTQEAANKLNISQGLIANCCNGGYWRDKHTKFINCNKVHNFKFKYK